MASDPSFVQQINPIPLGKKEKNNTKIKPFETVTYNIFMYFSHLIRGKKFQMSFLTGLVV